MISKARACPYYGALWNHVWRDPELADPEPTIGQIRRAASANSCVRNNTAGFKTWSEGASLPVRHTTRSAMFQPARARESDQCLPSKTGIPILGFLHRALRPPPLGAPTEAPLFRLVCPLPLPADTLRRRLWGSSRRRPRGPRRGGGSTGPASAFPTRTAAWCGIIRSQFCGVRPVGTIFRGALK